MERRIIDKRKKEKYVIDDEYLNGQAKLCGWQGTIVYNSLCRHANKNQESFPSVKKMAEQHNVHRDTILKGIASLEKRRVIEVIKTRGDGGKWLNNTYILLDKSEWDYSQVVETDTVGQVGVVASPSRCGSTNQVGVNDTKETHYEGNTLEGNKFFKKPIKTYSHYLSERRKEKNLPPKEKKKATPSQLKAIKRLKSLDYFHQQGVKNGFDYLKEEDEEANNKFIGLARKFEKRFGDETNKVIDWWFKGENSWCDYHPSNFFNIGTYMKYENSRPKKQREEKIYW